MYHKIVEYIIDHIESMLNKPVDEFIKRLKQNKNVERKKKKKIPVAKVFFQFIIHQEHYIKFEDCDR